MADGKASPAPAVTVTVTPTAPTAAASAGGRVLSRQDSTSATAAGSFDAWLAQKLKSEWSADELGALLTRERLADARASFPQLETPVKARLLLSFLSVRPEEAADCREAIGNVLALAEADSEEWVRMSAGMVRQFQFMDANGSPGDSFFHAQLAKTARAIVDAVADPKDSRERTLDDFLSLENALLNPSIRADVALAPAKHFTVLAPPPDANGKGGDRDARQLKKPLHRPQMARPLLHPSSTSSASAAAPTRLTPPSAKPPAPKKNVSDVTSEIRRKADAGRFKRQRSRISMIDIDEVKQIESEKAQKAEERKKQKLLAKEKEKAAAAVAGAPASGQAAAASDNTGEDASPPNASASGRDDSSADTTADASAAYEEHSDQQDTVSEDEQSGSVEASGHADADYEQVAHGVLYAADGARALLNAAAFHSSQDEVIHQEHLEQQQPQLPSYQPPAYHPQHALPPPPQFQQRGFEPEDAGSHLGFSGYGFGGQSSSSSSAGYFGDQVGSYRPQEPSPYGVYMSDPRQAPVQGNAAAHGFFPDQRGAFDPNAQRQQQQQQQQQQLQQQQPRQPLGGFLDGPPEYWR